MKQWIQEKLESLNGGSKTKWLLIGIAGMFILFLVRAAYNDRKAGLYEKPEENQQQGVIAPNVRDPSMTNLLNENASNKRELQDLRKMLEEKKKAGNDNGSMSREEVIRLIEELRKTDIAGGMQENPFENTATGTAAVTTPEGGAIGQDSSPPDSNVGEPSSNKSRFSRSSLQGSSDGRNGADDNETFLPPGTSLPYVLVSGVNAPTNLDGGNENAPMVLLRLKGKGIMPNGYTTDLSDCFVLGSSYGQYMDSRAIARPITISCIRDDGKAVEAKLKGTINGEDGKPGWQGRTVSKTGKVLAGLARVGAYQTAADTLANVAAGFNIDIGDSSSNGSTRTQVNLGGAAGQSAAKNMGSAFEKMAAIYEKYGNDAIPVIEVEPLRTGDIIVQEGVTLKFVKDVR